MAKSTLSSVLEREEGLGRRERALEGRLLPVGTRTIPQWQTSEVVLALMVPAVEVDEEIEERNGKKIGWKREMESLFKEVEPVFDVTSSDTHRQRTTDNNDMPVAILIAIEKGPHLSGSLF
jgi:hypothetical protein